MNMKKVKIVYQASMDEDLANRLLKYIYDHEDFHPGTETTLLRIARHFGIEFTDKAENEQSAPFI